MLGTGEPGFGSAILVNLWIAPDQLMRRVRQATCSGALLVGGRSRKHYLDSEAFFWLKASAGIVIVGATT